MTVLTPLLLYIPNTHTHYIITLTTISTRESLPWRSAGSTSLSKPPGPHRAPHPGQGTQDSSRLKRGLVLGMSCTPPRRQTDKAYRALRLPRPVTELTSRPGKVFIQTGPNDVLPVACHPPPSPLPRPWVLGCTWGALSGGEQR